MRAAVAGVAPTALAGTPEKPVTLPIFDDNPAIADGLAPETGTLKIFNYPDYVNPEVVAAFEERVRRERRDHDLRRRRRGHGEAPQRAVKTDLFLSASYNNLPRLVAGRLAQPMNRSYITNFGTILPSFQDPFYDKGSQYSVPYTVFGTGIGYRDRPRRPCRGRGQGLGDLLGPGLQAVGCRSSTTSGRASGWRCCARASPT